MKHLKIFESEDTTKATVIKAPGALPLALPGIFLAGSIEMGKAEDWQAQVQKLMANEEVELYNPRRDDWDSSWEQTIENDEFRKQVNWELNAMDSSQVIIMYLDPETKSPISLLELGIHAQSGKLLVCCPDGFYRKGNVDVVCAKYNIPQYDTIEELVGAAIVKINH